MFVDIHTHNKSIDNQKIIKIVNLDLNQCENFRGGIRPVSVFYSAGIHPWDADSFDDSNLEKISEICNENDVIAIGESGLDRIHKETFEKQKKIFFEMIEISEKTRKPLIIHSVRTISDIISARKTAKSKMPWIIHGFQGSLESAEQLISHGMFISFGEMLYKNENQAVDVIKHMPSDRLFLETDVSKRDIFEVYERAAAMIGCDLDFLEKTIFDNFAKIFGDGKLEEQDTDISWK